MRYFSPLSQRPREGHGVAAETLRPAILAGLPTAADTTFKTTRRWGARVGLTAPPSSLFERAGRFAGRAAPRAWRHINDNAHAHRRAPPGRNPRRSRQG